jgi:hypothetical protein
VCVWGNEIFHPENFALINFTGFWQNPAGIWPAGNDSIRVQSELNTFSVFVCTGLRKNGMSISARIAKNRTAEK